MKRILAALLVLALLAASGCAKPEPEEILHLGLNARIVEIDAANQTLYVEDLGDAAIFGGRCRIDCSEVVADDEIFYVDYETHELTPISFSDLLVGDQLILNAYESELTDAFDTAVRVEQIQLGTQRLVK